MEHESFVAGMTTVRLVQALRTPEAVRASLPGWQPDAAAGGDSGAGGDGTAVGRLRLRVGGTTITYRGTVTVSDEGPGFTVTATGTEVRGGGGVTVNAQLSVVTAVQPEQGVTLVWRGEAEATGRITALEPQAVESAVRRLLDRFCADLAVNAPPGEVRDRSAGKAVAGTAGAVAGAEAVRGDAGEGDEAADAAPSADAGPVAEDQAPDTEGAAPDDGGAAPGAEGATPGAEALGAEDHEDAEASALDDEDDAARDAEALDAADAEGSALGDGHAAPGAEGAPGGEDTAPSGGPGGEAEPEADVVDDLGEPVPPAELDDFELVEVEVEVPESAAALDDLVPPAEAAHARRTMIGRSAEEVDHAPPRGRYAPVPAPDSGSAAATLRWAAPVAAALVASAVVVGRVLRRRG